MNTENEYSELEGLARRGRWLAISTVAKSGAGHVGGPFSAMDILIALFFRAFSKLAFRAAFCLSVIILFGRSLSIIINEDKNSLY